MLCKRTLFFSRLMKMMHMEFEEVEDCVKDDSLTKGGDVNLEQNFSLSFPSAASNSCNVPSSSPSSSSLSRLMESSHAYHTSDEVFGEFTATESIDLEEEEEEEVQNAEGLHPGNFGRDNHDAAGVSSTTESELISRNSNSNIGSSSSCSSFSCSSRSSINSHSNSNTDFETSDYSSVNQINQIANDLPVEIIDRENSNNFKSELSLKNVSEIMMDLKMQNMAKGNKRVDNKNNSNVNINVVGGKKSVRNFTKSAKIRNSSGSSSTKSNSSCSTKSNSSCSNNSSNSNSFVDSSLSNSSNSDDDNGSNNSHDSNEKGGKNKSIAGGKLYSKHLDLETMQLQQLQLQQQQYMNSFLPSPHQLNPQFLDVNKNKNDNVAEKRRLLEMQMQQMRSNTPINLLRKGKWTLQEEIYADRIINAFSAGLLDLSSCPSGTTLRSYLADKLHCDPMRITKKFTGNSCLGKKIYQNPQAKLSGEESTKIKEIKENIKKTMDDLKILEERFLEKVELEGMGPRVSYAPNPATTGLQPLKMGGILHDTTSSSSSLALSLGMFNPSFPGLYGGGQLGLAAANDSAMGGLNYSDDLQLHLLAQQQRELQMKQLELQHMQLMREAALAAQQRNQILQQMQLRSSLQMSSQPASQFQNSQLKRHYSESGQEEEANIANSVLDFNQPVRGVPNYKRSKPLS